MIEYYVSGTTAKHQNRGVNGIAKDRHTVYEEPDGLCACGRHENRDRECDTKTSVRDVFLCNAVGVRCAANTVARPNARNGRYNK